MEAPVWEMQDELWADDQQNLKSVSSDVESRRKRLNIPGTDRLPKNLIIGVLSYDDASLKTLVNVNILQNLTRDSKSTRLEG